MVLPFRSLPRLLAAVLLPGIVGCSAAVQTTIEPEWRVNVGYDEVETAEVAADGRAVVVAEGKNVIVVNARTGEVVHEEEVGFLESVKQAALGGILGGDRYGYAFLPDADQVLIFDNTLADEQLRSLALANGEPTWMSEDYLWSLENYERAGIRLAQAVVGLEGAGAAAVVATFNKFVTDLVEPVPALDGFLLNTVDGLKLVDAGTGREIWSVPDFRASGVAAAEYLPGEHDLIVVGSTSGVIETVTGAKDVVRIDAGTGEVEWTTGYGGFPILKWTGGTWEYDMEVIGDRLMLNFVGSQVFDLETGEEIIETHEGAVGFFGRMGLGPGERDSTWTASPIVRDGAVYANFPFDPQADDTLQDRVAVKYDLETGERLWTTEEVAGVRGRPGVMAYVDGLLVAGTGAIDDRPVVDRRGFLATRFGAGGGSLAAWDAETGEAVWSKSDLGDELTNFVVLGSDLYIADTGQLLRIDARNGEVLDEAALPVEGFGDPGVVFRTGTGVAVLGTEAIAFFTAPRLARQNTIATADADTYAARADLLVVKGGGGEFAYVIDLQAARLLGTIADMGGAMSGNLRDGFHLAEDGSSIFILHSGSVAEYPGR